jgi:aminoglycoside 6-adenylyltransferase
MRTSDEIQKLITDIAISDDRIRAVILNGSRANPTVVADKYQDFDIVYIVTEIESFTSDHSWTNIFGDMLIRQLPDEMDVGKEPGAPESFGFAYLMLFKDGNRIDLTLIPKNKVNSNFHSDSLTVVWLDKDNIFANIDKSSNADYLVKRPSEKEFLETCNEFWWTSTNVAKGLLRNEITYAKEMQETVVRPMFMDIIKWYVGAATNFSVSFGKAGKFMKAYLPGTLYEKILSTYSDHQAENNWKSLFVMTEVFGQLAKIVASKLNFQYNNDEEKNIKYYLRQAYKERK